MIDTHQKSYLHRIIKPSLSLSLKTESRNLTEKAGFLETQWWGILERGVFQAERGTHIYMGDI